MNTYNFIFLFIRSKIVKLKLTVSTLCDMLNHQIEGCTCNFKCWNGHHNIIFFVNIFYSHNIQQNHYLSSYCRISHVRSPPPWEVLYHVSKHLKSHFLFSCSTRYPLRTVRRSNPNLGLPDTFACAWWLQSNQWLSIFPQYTNTILPLICYTNLIDAADIILYWNIHM